MASLDSMPSRPVWNMVNILKKHVFMTSTSVCFGFNQLDLIVISRLSHVPACVTCVGVLQLHISHYGRSNGGSN